MGLPSLDLDEQTLSLLRQARPSAADAAREMIVLGLFRRGAVSSGRAAELLGMGREEFIVHAGRLGIALFDMSEQEWHAECRRSEAL